MMSPTYATCRLFHISLSAKSVQQPLRFPESLCSYTPPSEHVKGNLICARIICWLFNLYDFTRKACGYTLFKFCLKSLSLQNNFYIFLADLWNDQMQQRCPRAAISMAWYLPRIRMRWCDPGIPCALLECWSALVDVFFYWSYLLSILNECSVELTVQG